jgi:hypothetical protein
MLGIRPYRTLENVIEGAVITFVDITRIKKAEALQRLAVVVRDATTPSPCKICRAIFWPGTRPPSGYTVGLKRRRWS